MEAPATREVFQKIIDGVNADLAQHERIKGFTILPAELTIDNGHLTPTLKVRRRIVEKAYSREIDEMYTPGTSARAAS